MIPLDRLVGSSFLDISTTPKRGLYQRLNNVTNERTEHVVSQHRLANGEVRDVEIYHSSILLKGKTLIHSIIHDVTARTAAEREIERRNRESIALSEIAVSVAQGPFCNPLSRNVYKKP